MYKSLFVGLAVASFSIVAIAAKPEKPRPDDDLAPRVDSLEQSVSVLESQVSGLQQEQSEQGARLDSLESLHGSTIGNLVVVDANDQLVGHLIQNHADYTHSMQRFTVAMKFPNKDRAYLIQLYGNLIGQDGYLEGSDDVMYLDSECLSEPHMRVSVSDTIGQRRNILDSVGNGRDGNYIPDPDAVLGESQTYYYSKWSAANNRCERQSSSSAWLVPAMLVEMNFQYPLKAVYR